MLLGWGVWPACAGVERTRQVFVSKRQARSVVIARGECHSLAVDAVSDDKRQQTRGSAEGGRINLQSAEALG
jgi:hypothetical protein